MTGLAECEFRAHKFNFPRMWRFTHVLLYVDDPHCRVCTAIMYVIIAWSAFDMYMYRHATEYCELPIMRFN